MQRTAGLGAQQPAVHGTPGTALAYVVNYRIVTDGAVAAASVVICPLPVAAVVLGAVVLRED